MKSKLFLFILTAILITPSLVFASWWNPFTWFNNWGLGEVKKEQTQQNQTSSNSNVQTGLVSIDNKCETLYQNFLTQYGTDYNTCFKDFNFSTSTCNGVAGSGDKSLNVLVILDSSGSMAGIIDRQKKIDIAKSAISKFLTSLPADTKVGLMVYGHKGSNSEADKALSCGSIDTIYPLSVDKSGLVISLTKFNANGWTPIADSLKKAEGIFYGLDASKNDNYIYIVSDGVETCDGDPVSIAKEINTSGIKAIVNVIGFDVDSSSVNKLKSIAVAGAGSFFSARNTNEFNKIFDENANWLSKSSCKNAQWLSATAKSNSVWLDMTSCINNVWLKETSASNKIWSDTNKLMNDLYAKKINTINAGFCNGFDRSKCDECLSYVSKKLSERHREMKQKESEIKEANKDKKEGVDNYLDSVKP